MKCISIRQPWAGLILVGHKPVENRMWQHIPQYRGPLLIHASKTAEMDEDTLEFIMFLLSIKKCVAQLNQPPFAHSSWMGAIIGIVDFYDALPVGSVKQDDIWRDPNQIGLYFRNPRIFEPIPYKGQLGLFEVPDNVIKEANNAS